MPIRVLPDQLASQIAAGEVVERPVSVVKELVENAVDAGATSIQIEVREAGRRLIQVADDGQGIPADEVETAFQRHATSKLATSSDLTAIGTLGFRGEALAAIAAVSRLTAVTRTDDGDAEAHGVRLQLEGGRVTGRERVGAPRGTVIAIEQLFYNVPARLKFLKSATTEKRLIDEFVTRFALAYPAIRFRLMHDGRVTFQSPGNNQVRDVLTAVYGPEMARELLVVGDGASGAATGGPSGEAAVSGYVGPPSRHWANRGHITLFVNGRWIKDNRLTYAVIQAYHTLLPTGRYPFAVLFVEAPPSDVDVNVHPAKTEIRFRGGPPFGLVQRAVREALVADSPVRAVGQLAAPFLPGWSGSLNREAFGRRRPEEGGADQMGLAWPAPPAGELPRPATPEGTRPEGLDPAWTPASAGEGLAGERLPIMRVVGQVGAAYIVAEGPDGLYLIDQHAAHERILYERFMADWDEEAPASQGLVAGTAVQLPPAQATVLEAHLETLAQLGFAVEPFGPQAYMVRAVPAAVAGQDPTQLLLEVVDDLAQGDAPLRDRIEARIVRRVCKTAAVKAGQTLALAEMEAMIRQLEQCQSPHTCPHGRPTLIHLSIAQLAREFGRI